MRNYASVNCRGVHKKFLENIYKHNVNRLQKGEKIDYLLKEEDSLGNNSKILLNGKFEQLKDFNQIKSNLDKLEEKKD